jgi:transposase
VWAELHRHVAYDSDLQRRYWTATVSVAQALGHQLRRVQHQGVCRADTLGNPLDFTLTGGQTAAPTVADVLVPDTCEALVADKGYDADRYVASLTVRGINVVIQRDYDRRLYKARHLIECFFGNLKPYRRLFSRFAKTAGNYLSFLHFVATFGGCGKWQ